MKGVKRKVFSVIISAFFVCNLFSGITTYGSDNLCIGENINALSNVKDSEESIRILVQLEEDAAVDKTNNLKEANKLEEEVKNSQQHIISKVEEITQNKVRRSYGYLVNGFSIEGKRKDICEIKKIQGVKSVEESKKIHGKMTKSNVLTEAEKVWNDCGYKGEGMVISVIDTGFDYTHKDFQNIDNSSIKITKELANREINTLGYGKYFNDKIPYGYNYCDGNDNIKNEKQVHGMHVAGIALANGEIKGVAPESQLLAMRVANNNGEFYNEDIIQAIEDSVKLGADVINMSFGTDGEYYGSNDLYKSAIDKAIKNGVICVNACGNAKTSSSSDPSTKSIENLFGVKDTSTVDVASLDSFSVASMDNTSDSSNYFFDSDNDNKGENMSSFSSWGPSPDLELKPEITAPGKDITSTVYNNSYETDSGTSMSSPNIAGGCALMLQSLKSKNIDNIDKISIVKCLMMNTAKVLINDNTGVIYSPRQQGAGLIQLEEAVKNNVTASDSRGKAYIALKNISNNNTSFEIVLNNYGDKNATYTLSDENLYTEICSNGKSVEKEIDGAKISFDKNSITVKPGETSYISGTVNIPENFEKQNFVEGYISLTSNDSKMPSISLPIMGFYGDYGSETIVDAPIYDSNTILGITGLGQLNDDEKSFDYYGTINVSNNNFSYGKINKDNSKIKVNSDYVAFSPNSDGTKDNVQLITYFLRNAKEYSVKILDKDKKVIGNERKFNNESKDIYSYYANYSISGLFNKKYSWDGTYYDELTGNNKIVDDGQYYVRITTCGYTENAKEQVIDLPVKVDTKAPRVEIENVSLSSSRWGYGGNLCAIKWKASDDLSGLSSDVYAYINGDLSSMVHLNNITESNGEYSATIQLNRGTNVESLTLNVSDNAGNNVFVTSDDSINVHDDTAPVISSISKYSEGSISYTSNSQIKFTVTGQDESTITCTVKNETAGISSTSQMNSRGQADFSLELTNGANLFSITLKDSYGNTSETKYFTVVYISDLKSLSAGFTNVKGTLTITDENTNNDIFNVKGYVTQKPKKVLINNEEVNVNSDLTFSYDLKLNQGLNKVVLSIEDNNGNISTESSARIYYDTVAPIINFDSEIDVSEDKIINTDKDKILVSGNACDNSTEYYVFINGNQILSSDSNKMQIINVEDSSLLNRPFSKEIELKEGLNIITINAVDIYGNKTTRKIKVNRNNQDNQDNSDNTNNQNTDINTDINNDDNSHVDNNHNSDNSDIDNNDKIEDNADGKIDTNDNNENKNPSSNGQSNKTYDNSLMLLIAIIAVGSIIVCRETVKSLKI